MCWTQCRRPFISREEIEKKIPIHTYKLGFSVFYTTFSLTWRRSNLQTTSTHFEVVQITVNHHLHNGNPSNGKKSLVWKLLLITRWHTHFLYKPPFWVETSLPLKLICVWLTSSHSMVVDCSTTTKCYIWKN